MNKTIPAIALMILIAALALTQIAMRDDDGPGIIVDRLARIDSAINTEIETGGIAS